MPANQVPRSNISNPLSRPESMDALLNDIGSNKMVSSGMKETGTVPARRKMIDRRDTVPQSKPIIANDRREGDRRQKQPKQKTETERKLEQDEIRLQQHRKRILLAGCEPVMGFNYDVLAMDAYPENALVAAARRDRDYWLFICSVFGSIFLFGLMGFVSPAIAGIACGLSFLSAIFAFSPLRRHFFTRPRLSDLLATRKQIEFRALNHIRLLEGKEGLAWRCQKLGKYNSNLAKPIFSGLYRFSKQAKLLKVVREKRHIRLYLMLMIEAQKAYKRLEKDFLEHHFKHLETGLNDSLSTDEAENIEQQLKMSNQQSGQ